MKALLLSVPLTICFSLSLEAQSLNSYRWESRLILLFTPSPEDTMFERQVSLLLGQKEEFEDRKVVFLFITPDDDFENTHRFLNAADAKKMYQKFGAKPFQFEMVLVGLDGYEKFRAKNRITPPSALINLIDKMPMRANELRRRNNRIQVKKRGSE